MVQKPIQLDVMTHKALKLASADVGLNMKNYLKSVLKKDRIFAKRLSEVTNKREVNTK
jgi:hypothetical protein